MLLYRHGDTSCVLLIGHGSRVNACWVCGHAMNVSAQRKFPFGEYFYFQRRVMHPKWRSQVTAHDPLHSETSPYVAEKPISPFELIFKVIT